MIQICESSTIQIFQLIFIRHCSQFASLALRQSFMLHCNILDNERHAFILKELTACMRCVQENVFLFCAISMLRCNNEFREHNGRSGMRLRLVRMYGMYWKANLSQQNIKLFIGYTKDADIRTFVIPRHTRVGLHFTPAHPSLFFCHPRSTNNSILFSTMLTNNIVRNAHKIAARQQQQQKISIYCMKRMKSFVCVHMRCTKENKSCMMLMLRSDFGCIEVNRTRND